MRHDIDAGRPKVIPHGRTAANPNAANENLDHREGVDERRARYGVEQDRCRLGVRVRRSTMVL
jgi:hypothetical protein